MSVISYQLSVISYPSGAFRVHESESLMGLSDNC